MYAIVKTGGKQYKVAPGDKLNIEKLEAEVGSKVELTAICVVDGAVVEADPEKAAATKVVAVVLEQFKGKKQMVGKFKRRKNYRRKRGHRQLQTRVQIESVGDQKAEVVAPVAQVIEEAPAEAAEVNFSAMTIAQLKEYAAENNISLTGITKKADIIAAIEA